MTVVAADTLLDACHFHPERLPAAMEEAARLLNFDYFCADFTQPRMIASERQREGIMAYFSGDWTEGDYGVRA